LINARRGKAENNGVGGATKPKKHEAVLLKKKEEKLGAEGRILQEKWRRKWQCKAAGR